MKKLILVDDDEHVVVRKNGLGVIEFDIPQEVLESLASGETHIVPEYIGWGVREGFLGGTTDKKQVMGPDPARPFQKKDAGLVNVVLTCSVQASDETLKECFLPYMTRAERIEKGLTR